MKMQRRTRFLIAAAAIGVASTVLYAAFTFNTNTRSALAVLLTVFWAAALLTQILSDAATAVLLVPVSLALAVGLGLPPEPFAVCTALGAVVAFLTPIGHHGNLLILNPGQYRFADFLRVGIPLTVLISLVSTWLARYIWLDGPLLPAY
jgi:di/tricarboxylate transporter